MSYLERNPTRQTTVPYSGISLNEASTVDNVGTVKDSSGDVITHTNIFPVSNYEYELDRNEAKRKIKVVRPAFLGRIISDMEEVMKYKKSSQFVTKRLKNTDNPRLRGG